MAAVAQREREVEGELEAAQRQAKELAAQRDALKSTAQAEDQAMQVGVCRGARARAGRGNMDWLVRAVQAWVCNCGLCNWGGRHSCCLCMIVSCGSGGGGTAAVVVLLLWRKI